MTDKLATAVIGLMVGLLLGFAATSLFVSNSLQPVIDLKEKCEQSLPRNQTCVVTFVPQPVK